MIKTPFESQDQVLYFTQPTLSVIPTLLSTTLSSVENGQTLQRFWSPLYIHHLWLGLTMVMMLRMMEEGLKCLKMLYQETRILLVIGHFHLCLW